MTTEVLDYPNSKESEPQGYREEKIGENSLGHVWDKVGDSIDLEYEVKEDPMKRPFFIKTEAMRQPDGSTTPANTLIVVNDVIVNLNRTKAGQPDVMSLDKALELGLLSPEIEIGKAGRRGQVVDSVTWHYGNGESDTPDNPKYENLLTDIEDDIYKSTGLSWQEFVEKKTARVAQKSSQAEIASPELSEVAKANIEALMETEMGPFVVEAYKLMLIDHPELSHIPIEVRPEADSMVGNSHHVDSKTGEQSVRLRLDSKFFNDFLAQKGLGIRLARFYDLFQNNDEILDAKNIAKIVMLHEFGHAADYMQRRSQKPTYNTLDFYALDRNKSKAEIESLPLKSSTLRFLKKYNVADPVSKIKICKSVGANDIFELDKLVEANTAAYVYLPSEKVADNFAEEQLLKQLST